MSGTMRARLFVLAVFIDALAVSALHDHHRSPWWAVLVNFGLMSVVAS